MQLNLFELNPTSLPPLPIGKSCKNCVHLIRHQYNKNMKYCGLKRQRGTAYGFKKIKANDRACMLFTQKLLIIN